MKTLFFYQLSTQTFARTFAILFMLSFE